MNSEFNSKSNIQNSSLQTTVLGFPTQRGPYIPRSIQGLQILGQWQCQQPDAPDLWLRLEIAVAFKQFVCLRLGNTPAVEMLPFVAETWIDTIGEGMTEALDRERIKAGFKQLYRTLKWWPQPAELLKVLPRRLPPPASPRWGENKAPAPSGGGLGRGIDDAEIDTTAGVEKLQDIINMLDQREREARHGQKTTD